MCAREYVNKTKLSKTSNSHKTNLSYTNVRGCSYLVAALHLNYSYYRELHVGKHLKVDDIHEAMKFLKSFTERHDNHVCN